MSDQWLEWLRSETGSIRLETDRRGTWQVRSLRPGVVERTLVQPGDSEVRLSPVPPRLIEGRAKTC